MTKLHWGTVSSNEMYSTYKRQRIVYYFNQGHKAPTISRLLHAEGLSASRRGIHKFLMKYLQTGSIGRRPGSGRPSKITEEIKAIVVEQMNKDDETTAYQLHRLLVSRSYNIPIHTIFRCRSSLASFPDPRPASRRLQYGKAGVLQATGSWAGAWERS